MGVKDERTREIVVARDSADSVVQLQFDGATPGDRRVIRLEREEARRLAALILFQSARLERLRPGWVQPAASRSSGPPGPV